MSEGWVSGASAADTASVLPLNMVIISPVFGSAHSLFREEVGDKSIWMVRSMLSGSSVATGKSRRLNVTMASALAAMAATKTWRHPRQENARLQYDARSQ